MSAPVAPYRQRILEAIGTALRAIDGNPTYHNKVRSTSVTTDPGYGPNIMTVPQTELPYFVVEPLDSGDKRYMPSMRVMHDFQVAITARNDTTNRAERMQTWERLIADIEKALTVDITLGGLAIDVRLLEATPGFDLGGVTSVFVVQPVVVRLIRTYGEP